MILTVANLKGGTSKTTSAGYLAHALQQRGRRVIVIDADPQCSITDWAEAANWTIPVRGMATGRLHVPGVGLDVEVDGYDVVVVDTPPSDKHRGIVESAIRAATHVVVPLAPTSSEVDRMPVVADLINDVSHLGRHGAPPVAAVLLTRTVAGAVSTQAYRELLVDAGWHVLRPTVARWERYAQALNAPVVDAANTAYGDALTELEGLQR